MNRLQGELERKGEIEREIFRTVAMMKEEQRLSYLVSLLGYLLGGGEIRGDSSGLRS
jgi:hypothetical protein